MPKFTVLSRKDAFIDYTTEVEAEDAAAAVDLAYRDGPGIVWRQRGVVQFDAVHMVALDGRGEEIESTARGDFL